jgi:hypothetical protein
VTVDCDPKPLHPVFDGGGVDLARMARDHSMSNMWRSTRRRFLPQKR